MAILTTITKYLLRGRVRAIEEFYSSPIAVQSREFSSLAKALAQTKYGREHGFTGGGYSQFAKDIPVVVYDQISDYIKLALDGEEDVLWPGKVSWFAKSSGTTTDKSKFIPISHQSLHQCQYRGSRDALALYLMLNPAAKMFGGKALTLGGSRAMERGVGGGAFTGDLSAVMIANAPGLTSMWRVPSRETSLISDFSKKVEMICEELSGVDVRSFAGVPSWNMVLLSKVVEYNGANNLLDVWPNMELFIHGGIAFEPYRSSFEKLIPSSGMHYLETYNASEGFFAVADSFGGDMLLMLDYGIFYEFLEMSHFGDHSKVIPLEDVKVGVNYAIIITTSSGLWRYMLGDTVIFSSTDPYRLRITGRTQHFINVFGEEVMVSNTDNAITSAAAKTGASIENYTVAPLFMEVGSKGAHQWAIEFRVAPKDLYLFTKILDQELQSLNSDYEAKRKGDSTLSMAVVTVASKGSFYRWMASKGRVGGQNKIPRLSSERKYIEELEQFF